jgi:hypothetical protein
MKLTMKVSDSISCEITADKQTDAFEQIASVQEIFGIAKCEKCQGTDIRYVVRDVDSARYYELRCNNPKCRAKLTFGVKKTGGALFPHRKDGDKWLPNGGWTVYVPPKEITE